MAIRTDACSMKTVAQWWIFIAVMSLGTSHAIAGTKIITTDRPAAELVPILQPHVGPNGHVQAADGFKLTVRADDAHMSTVLALLSEFNRPLVSLKIEVSFGENRAVSTHQAGITNVSVSRKDGETDVEYQGRIRSYSTDSARSAEQSVTVMEGEQAWIQSGTSQPYRSTSLYGTNTEFKDINQGFYVTPQITGQQVRLEISTQNNRLKSGGNNAIRVNESSTVAMVPLGQWAPLTQGHATGSRDKDGWTYSTKNRGARDQEVFVRVSIIE